MLMLRFILPVFCLGVMDSLFVFVNRVNVTHHDLRLGGDGFDLTQDNMLYLSHQDLLGLLWFGSVARQGRIFVDGVLR